MTESHVCLDTRASLEHIRSLKQDFDAAYAAAAASGSRDDMEKAQALKVRLESDMKNLLNQVYSIEAEQRFNLRHQYESQTAILKKAGLVEPRKEIDASGIEHETLVMKGINGKEYPMPSYENIARRLFEQRELMEIKADQGFIKLQLVPFGMSLDEMIKQFKKYLLDNKGCIPKVDPNQPALDESRPVWVLDKYDNADINGTLVYDPRAFSAAHGGKTKMEILQEREENDNASSGWRILLVQAGKDGNGIKHIPRSGLGTDQGTKSPRHDIEAGKDPQQYLEVQAETHADPTSPYHGEFGMAPEEWMMAFMTHFEETGKLLDESPNGIDSSTYLMGAYFAASGVVPFACWGRGDRRAYLFGFGPDGMRDNFGVRLAVRISP